MTSKPGFNPIRLATLVVLAALCGCRSVDPESRRQRLLEFYPPGSTTRAKVHEDFTGPDLEGARPTEGWAAFEFASLGASLEERERAAGKSIARFERYFAADGFMGLCWYWFYFDENDRLVDAAWQYHTD